MSDNKPLQPIQPAKITPVNITPANIFLGVAVGLLLFILLVWILQVSWNASLPKMFTGAKSITFMTALFFMIVVIIIFR